MKNSAEKVSKLLIGEKVNRLRNTHALTKEKLAEKAEVDVKTIHRLEKGEGASLDTLQRVAEALGVAVTEFTMLNLDYGSFVQRIPQELSSIKSSVYELLEIKKITPEEYNEMRELIEAVEKQKIEFTLPSLPAPLAGAENLESEMQLNVPLELLDELNLFDAIKRVMTETKPWVKYAPIDKNQPTLAHKLRQWGFISQPYFCKRGAYKIGLFKQGFPSHTGLYLVINSYETAEGAVVRLWPYHQFSSDMIILLYRSLSGNERLFCVNMREYKYETTNLSGDYNIFHGGFFPDLLNATRLGSPNFELRNRYYINNAWGYGFYYNPELVIKTDEQPPIHLPWTIELYDKQISLKFNCPTEEPMRFVRNLGVVSVNIVLGEHGYKQEDKTPHLTIIWPQFSEFVVKFLAFWHGPKYKRCNNSERIDLVKLTDQLTPEPKNE